MLRKRRRINVYKNIIQRLIKQSPLEINTKIVLSGRPPTMANSEFLTNKEQGDWAEQVVFKAINDFSSDYFAVKYGRSDSLAAGEEGFIEFYKEYQEELNTIGKRPDLLLFKLSDFPKKFVNIKDNEHIKKAVAALEVRSSSFLAKKYSAYMTDRQQRAVNKCIEICNSLRGSNLGNLLKRKNKDIYRLISKATGDTFRNLDFRCPSWLLTRELRDLTTLLRELKESIKILHKRDYLSITPKMEDIALVNRWIQNYNVQHFYLQVFFDKAYVISFKDILKLISDDSNEEKNFSIEQDVKNQGKTTIKINVQIGREVLGRIDMPKHNSAMKELERGRLLFYVKFKGGKGYLDRDVFMRDIINA